MRDLMTQLINQLEELDAKHRTMCTVLDDKAAAMSKADNERINQCVLLENELLQQIGEIEKHRQAIVADITMQINPQATELLTLKQIAAFDQVDRRQAEHLLLLHQQLMKVVDDLKFKATVIQQAAQGILQNIRGIMQNVGSLLSDAGTYGNKGTVRTCAPLASSLSITA